MSGEGLVQYEELLAATGEGVRVLVVDSGAEAGHPALGGRTVACWTVEESAGFPYFRVVPDEAGDLNGHGTAVVDILARHAPAASIDSLRVLGRALGASSPAVLAGISWGIDQGYDVINCSLGSASARHLEDYKRVVDRAFCKNALLVGASNNFDLRRVEYPASFPTVISTDFAAMPAYSLRRITGQLIEFMSPGANVRAAWVGGGWRQVSGSSFAAPHLAALVCRLRQLRPDWNACQIKVALYELAKDPRMNPELPGRPLADATSNARDLSGKGNP